MTQPSHYRELHARRDLDVVVVSVAESNIRVAGTNLSAERVRTTLAKARRGVEECIHYFPTFLTSLTPVELPRTMPAIAQRMANAATRVGVGPMAAVAGAIAEAVACDLATVSPEVLVENGGDLFCIVRQPRLVALAQGSSTFEAVLGLRLDPKYGPCGIATSSGTSGESLSFGRADLMTVVARTGALADAVATAAGNRALEEKNLQHCVDFALSIEGVIGAIAIMRSSIALRGHLDLVNLN